MQKYTDLENNDCTVATDRIGSWQIADSISVHISKSLWTQTRYSMSHCLILIYVKCTAVYREGVVMFRCWMSVLDESLVEMISNWCCTWNKVQRQTTTHAAISGVQRRGDIQEKESLKYCYNSLPQYEPHKGVQWHSCTISCMERLGFQQR